MVPYLNIRNGQMHILNMLYDSLARKLQKIIQMISGKKSKLDNCKTSLPMNIDGVSINI